MVVFDFQGNPVRKSIVVQTREGNEISNEQSFHISHFENAQIQHYENGFLGVTRRSNPSPIYNCHGLTFASKRTGIYEPEEVHKILNEDKYVKITNIINVLPGDIILYASAEGDIEHSGIVIEIPDNALNIPKVISKWGKYCEIIHYANSCPYDFSNVSYYRVMQ